MAAPPQPLTIDIVNNSTNLLHVYVVGTKLGNGSQPQFIMKPDGKTSSDLLPGMPSGRLPPGTGDGTVLYKQGDKFSFNINFFFSGRVYIAYSNSLPWSINAGSQPALVHPSPTTPGYDAANPDSAIGGLTQWSFCELTYDQSGLTTNISYVDSVGLLIYAFRPLCH